MSSYTLSPNAPPLYNDDGSLHWEEWVSAGQNNPLVGQYSSTRGDIQNLISNLVLSYELLNGLSIRTNLGYTKLIRESKTKTFNEIVAPDRREGIPHRAAQNYNNRLSWIIEPQLVFNTTFGGNTLDALIGGTFQHNESDGFSISGQGFTSKSLVGYFPAAETIASGNNRNILYRYNAVFGRLGYNYQAKYYINLTGRRDGSSRFGPNNRFANFWALGMAWVVSEEPFIKNHLPFISFGKLRGSFGVTGSDQIGDYGYLDAYEATPAHNGLYPTQLFNSNFAWEENKKLEFALELGFSNDFIIFGANWYRNRSSNQLVGSPLPAMTGYTTVQANLPATVQNTGWDLELSIPNFLSKDFSWRTSLNLSFPKNKLLSFPNIDQTAYFNIYKVGQPLNMRLVYQYNGINPNTGLHQIVDANEDGSYDYQDRIINKNLGRKFYGGITNEVAYHRFRFSLLWEFVKQNAMKPRPFFISDPGDKFNRPIEDYIAWQNGDLFISQSPDASMSYGLAMSSDYGIIDASFLRLRTLSISYGLPSGVLKNVGIKDVRIFCSTQNLLTISGYPGNNLDNPGLGPTLPPLKTITTGIEVNF